jgi:hypothetical protein
LIRNQECHSHYVRICVPYKQTQFCVMLYLCARADRLVLSNTIRVGILGLGKTLSKELGRDGITVNTVYPGWTLTERVAARAQVVWPCSLINRCSQSLH